MEDRPNRVKILRGNLDEGSYDRFVLFFYFFNFILFLNFKMLY